MMCAPSATAISVLYRNSPCQQRIPESTHRRLSRREPDCAAGRPGNSCRRRGIGKSRRIVSTYCRDAGWCGWCGVFLCVASLLLSIHRVLFKPFLIPMSTFLAVEPPQDAFFVGALDVLATASFAFYRRQRAVRLLFGVAHFTPPRTPRSVAFRLLWPPLNPLQRRLATLSHRVMRGILWTIMDTNRPVSKCHTNLYVSTSDPRQSSTAHEFQSE